MLDSIIKRIIRERSTMPAQMMTKADLLRHLELLVNSDGLGREDHINEMNSLIDQGVELNPQNWRYSPLYLVIQRFHYNKRLETALIASAMLQSGAELYQGNYSECDVWNFVLGRDVDQTRKYTGHAGVEFKHAQIDLIILMLERHPVTDKSTAQNILFLADEFGDKEQQAKIRQSFGKEFYDTKLAKEYSTETLLHWVEQGLDPADHPELLFRAISLRNPTLVAKLLERGADVNREVDKTLPLTAAFDLPECDDNNTILLQLIKARADIKTPKGAKNSYLARALHDRRDEVACALIDAGADVNEPDQYGDKPLTLAMLKKCPQAAIRIIGKGVVDIHEKDKAGNTWLMTALAVGMPEVADTLMAHEVDIHAVNKAGESALILANPYDKKLISVSDKEMYQKVWRSLVEKGADANQLDSEKRTQLQLALEQDDKEGFSLLLEHGADPNLSDDERRAPLILANELGRRESWKLLIEKGADVSQPDINGFMQLHLSAERGDAEGVALLLAHNAEVDAVDGMGNSALMLAAKVGRIDVVDKLIEAGANPQLKNAEGKTAIDLARESANAEMMGFFGLSNENISRAKYVPLQACRNVVELIKTPLSLRLNSLLGAGAAMPLLYNVIQAEQYSDVMALARKDANYPEYLSYGHYMIGQDKGRPTIIQMLTEQGRLAEVFSVDNWKWDPADMSKLASEVDLAVLRRQLGKGRFEEISEECVKQGCKSLADEFAEIRKKFEAIDKDQMPDYVDIVHAPHERFDVAIAALDAAASPPVDPFASLSLEELKAVALAEKRGDPLMPTYGASAQEAYLARLRAEMESFSPGSSVDAHSVTRAKGLEITLEGGTMTTEQRTASFAIH